MDSTDQERLVVEKRTYDDDLLFGKWVSLTCDNDQFDISCGRVRCGYSTADFMMTVHGDAVVLVPAAFHFVSQMVAHAVLSDRGDGHVWIAVRRPSIQCALSYRFAYVDGRLYEVMGVSDTFTFVHHDGPCDCSAHGNTETAADAGCWFDADVCSSDGFMTTTTAEQPTTAWNASADNSSCSNIMSSFISSLMDVRSSAPQCSTCKGPSNYRQVLEHLTKNIHHLSDVNSDIETERIKQIECLNNCTLSLEYLKMKTKVLNREMENCRLFVEGLVSSLLKNRKAIIQTGDKTVFVKTDEISENKCSATERFMVSIVNSQKLKIANLTNTYNEILIMMNTIQLFTKVIVT